ncbi:hypothetical protein CTI12_AA267100 [Artemisia annua]|uniref:Uncharacterized protein n=1 Tax=Artemisia annua TaxID=35608 RepID=A0A2U1NH56_ARTAN|nr:hypothetical protein CTI12_AA267100 [Artemisia annua]
MKKRGRLKAYEERIKEPEKMEKTLQGVATGVSLRAWKLVTEMTLERGRGRGRGSVRGSRWNERVRDKSRKCYQVWRLMVHYNNECPKMKEQTLIEEELALL